MFYVESYTKAKRVALGGAVFCMMTALVAQLRSEARAIGKAQLSLETVLSPYLVDGVATRGRGPISPNIFRAFGASSTYLTWSALTTVSNSESPIARSM